MLCRHSDIVVQEFRRDIRAIGPHQRMKFGVNLELLKHRRIAQWFKDGPLKRRTKIDFACGAVAEPQPDDVSTDVARLDDVVVHDSYSKGAIRLRGWPSFASCQS